MNVRYSPEAIEDLRGLVEFLGPRNPQAGHVLVERIFAIVDELAERAFDGPEHQLTSGEIVRSWPVPPVRVFYRRTADNVLEVVRVYHHARRPL